MSNSNSSNDRGNQPSPSMPYLIIPYYKADVGDRPLPITIPSWWCTAIHVGGVPYLGTPLVIGVATSVSVVVFNHGTADTLTTVRVYWADPATAFTPPSLTLIGQRVLPVVSGSTVETPPIPWTPKAPIPTHVCLLAEATSATDPVSLKWDVANDRHKAQQNININTVGPGASVSFEFWIANPESTPELYAISIRPIGAGTSMRLEAMYNAEVVVPTETQLMAVGPNQYVGRVRQASDPNRQLITSLRPFERQLCQVILTAPESLGNNQFIAVEVEQLRISQKQDTDAVTASLSLIAFADTT